ncbi:MAG TPA: BamA/TamA family outer membrane protein [Candidatus Cloacimonadota bacterium]|nr:BamA/TamA family outer membrane protein [Candidatus Cloacimonadota bacterium]
MKRILSTIALLLAIISLPAKTEIAAYPAGGYGNETGFYGGALGYVRYQNPALPDSLTQDVYYVSTTYSQKKQFSIQFEPTLYFGNGKSRLHGELMFKKWPSVFYGIGMNAKRKDEEKYTPRTEKLLLDFRYKFYENKSLELHSHLMNYEITKTESDGILRSKTIPGSADNFLFGLGLSFCFDDRNSETYPTRGEFLRIKFMHYDRFWGSDYNFSVLQLDLRKYFRINAWNTLAMQSFLASSFDQVPFYQLNFLDEYLRAITNNLYNDKHLCAFRIEDRIFPWRWGLGERLGFVVFAETGEVADRFDHFNSTDLQINYGLGLRYSLFLQDRLNVRIDVGYGEVKANLSIASGEVF